MKHTRLTKLSAAAVVLLVSVGLTTWVPRLIQAHRSQAPTLATLQHFLDEYYVMANQTGTLPLTTGQAHSQIQAEIKLLESMTEKPSPGSMRSILYHIEEERHEDTLDTYLVRLTIKIPEIEERTEWVFVQINTESKKVTHFGPVESGRATGSNLQN